MKNILKLGFTLAVFSAAACVMLAFVYSGTKTIIDRNQKEALEASLKDLFPDADRFEEIAGLESPDASVAIESQYKVLQDEEITGAALRVSRGSYGGPIRMLVGVNADGLITGVKILEHKDTPGLGAKAASPKYFVNRAGGITFYGQFAGKAVGDPFEVKGDVQAITASTVTSRAVADAVKAAGRSAMAWLAGEYLEIEAVSGASDGDSAGGGGEAEANAAGPGLEGAEIPAATGYSGKFFQEAAE
jgi:electron transport complex protein RnfG